MEKNILVADDDRNVVEIVRRIFEKRGYNVYTAYNGKDALEIVKKEYQNIDRILSDTLMPVMDGPEFMKNCRALGYNDIIIQMHGGSAVEKAKPADYLIDKPFDIAKLVELVDGEK